MDRQEKNNSTNPATLLDNWFEERQPLRSENLSLKVLRLRNFKLKIKKIIFEKFHYEKWIFLRKF